MKKSTRLLLNRFHMDLKAPNQNERGFCFALISLNWCKDAAYSMLPIGFSQSIWIELAWLCLIAVAMSGIENSFDKIEIWIYMLGHRCTTSPLTRCTIFFVLNFKTILFIRLDIQYPSPKTMTTQRKDNSDATSFGLLLSYQAAECWFFHDCIANRHLHVQAFNKYVDAMCAHVHTEAKKMRKKHDRWYPGDCCLG